MKKVISLLMIIVLTIPFFSCGKEKSKAGCSKCGKTDTTLICSECAAEAKKDDNDDVSSDTGTTVTPNPAEDPAKARQRFLCWDNTKIAKSSGLDIIQHKPQKQNIVLSCQDDWEGVHTGYPTIIKVDDTYRLYYRTSGQDGEVYLDWAPTKALICVAESKDGINFTKPVIGKIEYDGSKENNAIFENSASFSVFYDTNPDCPKEEKFKALSVVPMKEILSYYCSADGYNFKHVDYVRLSDGIYDTYNTAFWDEDEKVYKLYYRGWHRADGTTILNGETLDEYNDIRDIRLAISKDFRTWEKVDVTKIEGYNDPQMYTNQIAPYYREKNTFLGFPLRYLDRVDEKENFKDMPIASDRDLVPGRSATAITDCGIMTSSDGLKFNLRKSAFLTPGPETSSNWWYGNCVLAYGMAETIADDGENREISMYVGEGYRVKKNDIRRYTVRLDGFFSWYGDGNGATVTTKTFTLKHDEMFVNFATSALGSLKITILDKNGKAIDGYKSGTLFGDSTNRPVRFTKSLKDLVGKEIKLKIELNDCNLYSYTFE